jgi:hypothetical protein
MTERLAAARDLLRRFPLVDGHNDLPWEIREKFGGDPVRAKLSGPVPATRTDLPRLAETDCAALAGGNLLRVLRDAGKYAGKYAGQYAGQYAGNVATATAG